MWIYNIKPFTLVIWILLVLSKITFAKQTTNKQTKIERIHFLMNLYLYVIAIVIFLQISFRKILYWYEKYITTVYIDTENISLQYNDTNNISL